MIEDPLAKSSICLKHNLELKYLHPNQSSQQKFACRQCIDEFYHVIKIEKIIESNQELIQGIESQSKSNSTKMNLVIHSLISLRETINKKIEILINEIRKQIQINDEDTFYIKENVLNKSEIKQQHQKSLESQRIFQRNVIQQIESLKQNPGIDWIIQTLVKLNLERLNDEIQSKIFSIVEITQQPDFNENQVQQYNKDVQRYEYQLQEKSSIEHRRNCYAIAFNKDASIVVVGESNDIKVFEFQNEKLKEIQLLQGHSNCITCLQFMKNSNCFISGSSWDKTIKIWKQDNNNRWINEQTLFGHEDWVNCLVFNHNEDLIISGGQDKSIIFWKLNNTKWSNDQTVKCASQVYSLSFNNTNTKLVSSDRSKSIQVFEQNGSKWEIIQKINTNIRGFRICFLSEDDFVFLPENSGYLHCYNFNQKIKQFQKADEFKIQNSKNDTDGFPIQFITQKNLLIVKNGKFINILSQKENGKFILEQKIEFDDYHTYGSVSNSGLFLITWNEIGKKIQLRKLVENS